MASTLDVLIVEDDFRVADINRQQVEKITGFRVVGTVKTAAEALDYLQSDCSLPHLILLDVFIPDSPGLQLFRQLRSDYPMIDIVLLTAAEETETIAEALSGGVFDYLIKPVGFERFEQTFIRYRSRHVLLASKPQLNQDEIDGLLASGRQVKDTVKGTAGLPKGIDRLTLERIEKILRKSPEKGINAMDVGEAAGVSRSTARRYLEYLVSANQAETLLNYGDVGRPERKYAPKE